MLTSIRASVKCSARAVLFVNDAFLPKTPDPQIEAFARNECWIMLSGRESQQVERVAEVCDPVEALHGCALRIGRRFVVTIGPNWIRFDDQVLNRSL